MRQHAKLIGTVAILQVVAAAGIAGVARAQTNATYLITFDGQVTPQNPTMAVSVWAAWDDPANGFVFGGTLFDFEASEGVFSNAQAPLSGPFHPPTPIGNRIPSIATGQLHIPPLGIFGRPDNPILILTADWTTTDFTPRSVVFESSRTSSFAVAHLVTGATTQLFPQQFSRGRAVYVIPAPSSLALIALGGLAAVRRRRVRGR